MSNHTFAINPEQPMLDASLSLSVRPFRLIMEVTNVNDVRVYNLTCAQKAVPEVRTMNELGLVF